MDKKQKIILVAVDVLLSIGVMIGCFLFFFLKGNPGFIGKCVGSGLFVVLAFFNYFYLTKYTDFPKNNLSILLILGGIIFSCGGDVVLEIDFIIGAIIFAVGHIFYLVAFMFMNRFRIWDLVFMIGLSFIAILIILLVPAFDFRGIKGVACVYGVILSSMTGKAISNFVFTKNKYSLYIMIAAVFFFISDAALMLYQFYPSDLRIMFRAFCLFLYYPCCILFAFAPIARYKFIKDK